MRSTLVVRLNEEEAWLEGGESPLWGDIYEDTVAFMNLLLQEVTTNHSKTSALLLWDGMVCRIYPCYHRECDTMETMIDYRNR